MHGVRLGDGVRLLGIEGEAVTDIGSLVADFYGAGVTFPLGYTDGCQLYLPTDAMLTQGGYEVVSYYEYGFPAGLAPEVDGALRSGLQRLRREGIR